VLFETSCIKMATDFKSKVIDPYSHLSRCSAGHICFRVFNPSVTFLFTPREWTDKGHNNLDNKPIEIPICEMVTLHISTFFPLQEKNPSKHCFRGMSPGQDTTCLLTSRL